MAKVRSYKWLLVVLIGGVVFGATVVLQGTSPPLPPLPPATTSSAPFTSTAAVQPPRPASEVVEQQPINQRATSNNEIAFAGRQEQASVGRDVTDALDIRQRVYEIQQLGATTGVDAVDALSFTLQDPVAEIRMASIDSLRQIAARMGDSEGFISTLFRNAAADTDSAIAAHASTVLMELTESQR